MTNMPKLNKTASRILDVLTDGLGFDEGRKFDNSDTFMAVSVYGVDYDQYSVTHYFEQNGDLVPDPDMVFLKEEAHEDFGGNRYYPVSYQNSMGTYQRALHFNARGEPASFNPHMMRDMARFANDWMKNIKMQQDIKVPRKRRKK